MQKEKIYGIEEKRSEKQNAGRMKSRGLRRRKSGREEHRQVRKESFWRKQVKGFRNREREEGRFRENYKDVVIQVGGNRW